MDARRGEILDDLLTPTRSEDLAPEHRAWINAQVKERLAKVDTGEMGLKSLKEVRLKFGLDGISKVS